MKKKFYAHCWGIVIAIPLALAMNTGVAAPPEHANRGAAPPRPHLLPEVVQMRTEVSPEGKSAQKHPQKNGARADRGLRSSNPGLTRNSIVVVPGEFTRPLEVRTVPQGKPDNPGKPTNPGKPDNPGNGKGPR